MYSDLLFLLLCSLAVIYCFIFFGISRVLYWLLLFIDSNLFGLKICKQLWVEDLGRIFDWNKFDFFMDNLAIFSSLFELGSLIFSSYILQASYILINGTSSVWTATLFTYFLIFLRNELGINANKSLGKIEFTLAISIICIFLDVLCISLGADYLLITFFTNFLFFKRFLSLYYSF